MATIRSVVRALAILRAMGESREFSLRELHRLTQLPKPTIFRILSTLQSEGYVVAEPSSGRYRLAQKVRELGRGYTIASLLIEVAAPIVRTVTAQIKWPLAIGVLEEREIVVRYSTMPESPLAVRSTTLGHRHPLLESAMGQAYICFCSASERNALLDRIPRELTDAEAVRDRVKTLTGTVRRRGYGLRLPRRSGDSGTIAVPIRMEERVLAVLSMTTFGVLMNHQTITQHLPVLLQTAQRIAAAFADRKEEMEI